MKLTADAVEKLAAECVGTGLDVDGLVHKFSFDKGKIEQHKAEIGDMLAELPRPFQAKGGGGWSFLNGCQDKNGGLWTGMHITVEKLVCLGIAAGMAEWQMKDMTDILPGGVPYFVVKA